MKNPLSRKDGRLVTGEEPQEIDERGIKFTIESMLQPLKFKKSKLKNSWTFNCSRCGEKQSFTVDDARIGLTDKVTGRDRLAQVVIYQAIAQDASELEKHKDFIGYLAAWDKIVRKHEAEAFSRMRKRVSGDTQELKCTFCKEKFHIGVTAEATLTTQIPFTVREAEVELGSETAKRELERIIELYGTENAEKLMELGETAELIPLLKKKPLKWLNRIECKIKWDNKELTPKENAKEFSKTISQLQADIAKAPSAVNRLIETIETELVEVFKTDTARHMGMNILSDIKTNFATRLEKKLNRQLLENLSWLMKQVYRMDKGEEEGLHGA